jgi:hypothetical protein
MCSFVVTAIVQYDPISLGYNTSYIIPVRTLNFFGVEGLRAISYGPKNNDWDYVGGCSNRCGKHHKISQTRRKQTFPSLMHARNHLACVRDLLGRAGAPRGPCVSRRVDPIGHHCRDQRKVRHRPRDSAGDHGRGRPRLAHRRHRRGLGRQGARCYLLPRLLREDEVRHKVLRAHCLPTTKGPLSHG